MRSNTLTRVSNNPGAVQERLRRLPDLIEKVTLLAPASSKYLFQN